MLPSAFDIALKPTAAINRHGAFPKNRSLEQWEPHQETHPTRSAIALDRQGIVEATLPGLRGKYNIRDILEGVESKRERARDLDIREEHSRKSREYRPIVPKTPENPNLLKPSLALLLVFAVVACIVAVFAHFVPDSKHITSVLAIIFIFALIVIVGLLWTGKIKETTLNQFLEGFWRSITIFKGQEPKTNNDDTSQETPESEQ